jgi:hypothetical protein
MAFSNQPLLTIEDSNLTVNNPIFARYENNMSVEMLIEEDETLYTPKNATPMDVAEDDVEDILGVHANI